ncbi:MAG: protein kinase domain-containing protein [Planctomycetota bacterium]|jgi:serine/threonine protein kinase/uncharacterized coiled-coil protein SlyX
MSDKPSDRGRSADEDRPPPARNDASKAGSPARSRRLAHFRLLARIGRGATGSVYRAYDESLDRHVAVKVLDPRLAQRADCVRRFRQGATAAARIAHPNVLPVHYVGADAGYHFLAMDLVDGRSLAAQLTSKKAVALDAALSVAEQCLAGLQAAHEQGLVHGNLKPGNVLVERDSGRVVLTDFGGVRPIGADGPTPPEKPERAANRYTAPEQAGGATPDAGSDLYSLGVVLYHLLCGTLPWEREDREGLDRPSAHPELAPLGQLVPGLPEPVAAFVARLTAPDPLERYVDCATALADLRAIRKDRAERGKAAPPIRPPFQVVPAPEPAPEPVPLPPELDRLAAPSLWQRFRDWAATVFRRHAPPFVRQLQSTTQVVDGAIAQYERRRRRLAGVQAEAESVLAELDRQIYANRMAAEKTKGKMSAKARASRQAIQESLAALEKHRDRQRSHLDQIRSQVGEVEATLAKLRRQRDLLMARLQSAKARLGPEESGRIGRYRLALALLGALLVVVVVVWALLPSGSSIQQADVAERPQPDSKPEPKPKPKPEPKPPLPTLPEPAESLLEGLILYLTFEPETFRSAGHRVVVEDLSGRENYGLVYGPEPMQAGRVGQCITLDGIGDYIRFPTLLNTEVEQNDAFSLSIWIHDTKYKENVCIIDGVYSTDKGPKLTRQAEGRRLTFAGLRQSPECSAGGVGARAWHHVVGVWHGGGVFLFVDGELVDRQAAVSTPPPQRPRKPMPCTILGCRLEQEFETYYAGLVDEVLMFNRALAEVEVKTLYRMGMEGDRPEPPDPDPPIASLPPGPKLDEKEIAQHLDWIEQHRERFARQDSPDATAMAVTPDGQFAYLGSSVGVAFLRDLVNWRELARGRGQPSPHAIHQLVLREDEYCWAACGSTDVIFVTHLAGEGRRAMIRTKMKEVLDVAFLSDGNKLLAGGVTSRSKPEAASLCLWDLDTRKLIGQFPLPSRRVTAVACSPDGTRALAASAEGYTIRIVSLENGSEMATLAGHSGRVNRVRFLPDGRRAVSVSDDATVRLWDLDAGSEIRRFEGHAKPVRSVDVSPDGRYVFSGGNDGLCAIWHIETGELVSYEMPGASEIAAVQFFRDGRFAAILTRAWSFWQIRVPTVVARPAEPKVLEAGADES